MNFQQEMVEKILSGEKRVTRRLMSDNPRSPWWKQKCAILAGKDYAVTRGRGSGPAVCRVHVTMVKPTSLCYVDDEEARLEGFADAAAFRAGWQEINGVWEPMARVWAVYFHLGVSP